MRNLRHLIVASGAVVAAFGCSPDTTTDVTGDTLVSARQAEIYQRQLDKTDEQLKAYEEQLVRSKMHADRYDALLKKWDDQTRRFDRVLDAWERRDGGATREGSANKTSGEGRR